MNAALSRLAAVALALACIAPVARAQDARTLHFVVPVTPGGSLDVTTRRIATQISATNGAPVLVENRPGGNTLIGAEYVARSTPDGTTVFFGATSTAITALMQNGTTAFDSLVPVAQITFETYALVVPTSSPVNSLKDLEQVAASRKGGLNCAAVTGAPEIACEQLRTRLRGGSTTIPYQGVGAAVESLAGGHADLMFSPLGSVLPLVQGNRLRLIAATSRAALPAGHSQVPLLAEAWPGFVLEGFLGAFVPRRTPPERIAQLNRQINAALEDPVVRESMRSVGQTIVGGSPERFADVLRRVYVRYRSVVRENDIARQ